MTIYITSWNQPPQAAEYKWNSPFMEQTAQKMVKQQLEVRARSFPGPEDQMCFTDKQ